MKVWAPEVDGPVYTVAAAVLGGWFLTLAWRLRRDQEKFDHMLEFARALPKLPAAGSTLPTARVAKTPLKLTVHAVGDLRAQQAHAQVVDALVLLKRRDDFLCEVLVRH